MLTSPASIVGALVTRCVRLKLGPIVGNGCVGCEMLNIVSDMGWRNILPKYKCGIASKKRRGRMLDSAKLYRVSSFEKDCHANARFGFENEDTYIA